MIYRIEFNYHANKLGLWLHSYDTTKLAQWIKDNKFPVYNMEVCALTVGVFLVTPLVDIFLQDLNEANFITNEDLPKYKQQFLQSVEPTQQVSVAYSGPASLKGFSMPIENMAKAITPEKKNLEEQKHLVTLQQIAPELFQCNKEAASKSLNGLIAYSILATASLSGLCSASLSVPFLNNNFDIDKKAALQDGDTVAKTEQQSNETETRSSNSFQKF